MKLTYGQKLCLTIAAALLPLLAGLLLVPSGAGKQGDAASGLWLAFAISTITSSGMGYWVIRQLRQQLGAEPEDLVTTANSLAEGKYSSAQATCKLDESAGVARYLCVVASKLELALAEAETKDKEASARAAEIATMLQQSETRESEVKAMLAAMQAASKKAEQAAERIFNVIKDLNSNMSDVTRDVVVQKDRMASTRTAMDQMNEAILEIARNTGNAAQSAEQSKSNAQKGAQGVREAVKATEQVKARILSLKEKMAQLGGQADNIGQVIGVITDIADQTNLLALNAAIEAARAGDAGRGFAVVADEVRKLAEKTMTATKQVSESVQSIQASAKENVAAVESAAQDIVVSANLAEQAGDSMEEIVGIVQTTALEVASIATASEEQSATSEEIKRAVNEVNDATEHTAHSVDQAQRIAVEISSLAEELDTIIQGIASGKLDSAVSSDKLFEWSPALSIKITSVDDQHKVLIDLINELHAAMRQRKSDKVMLDVVARLKDYTVKHFGYEENLFAKHHYPEEAGHKELHRKFVQKIADFEASLQSGTATVGMEVMRFLKDWLVKHIQGTDTRYAPFMIERGVR